MKHKTLNGILILVPCIAALLGVAYWWNHRAQTNLAPQQLYAVGDLSGTLAAIESSAAWSSEPELQMLTAGCYRQLGQMERLKEWVRTAQERGFSSEQVQLTKDLADIQMGAFEETTTRLLRALERRGASQIDTHSVVIHGLVARGEFEEANRALDHWQIEQPAPQHILYLRGLVSRARSQWTEAESFLIQAIEANPRHELSYLALSEFYSQPPNIDLLRSRFVLQQLTQLFPHNAEAQIRLVRAHRELGELADGRAVLQNVEDLDAMGILERAELELDSGHFDKSVDLLAQAQLVNTIDFVSMIDAAFSLNLQGQGSSAQALTRRVGWAATALSLSGKTQLAATIFNVALDRVARLRRFADLQVQLSLAPSNQVLIDELNAVVSPAFTPAYPTMDNSFNTAEAAPQLGEAERLYALHCSVCHGRDGDGFGPAARHLFPAPRNFRREPMRIVSATNRLATDDDLARTIRHGLGGASMPAFAKLNDHEIALLVEHIRKLQREGLHEQYQRQMADLSFGSASDDGGSGEWVAARLLPAAVVHLPEPIGVEVAVSDAEGAALFRRAGCRQCHGIASAADSASNAVALFDEVGRPLVARDLVHSAYRGGNTDEAIYRRIVLGMPGTPHPAFTGFEGDDLRKLVAYVRQLSQSTTAESHTNYDRLKQLEQFLPSANGPN